MKLLSQIFDADSTEFKEAKEGDKVVFDMPSFCSGNYASEIKKDVGGSLYIKKFWGGCRDYFLVHKRE